jgi:hypothetical protein
MEPAPAPAPVIRRGFLAECFVMPPAAMLPPMIATRVIEQQVIAFAMLRVIFERLSIPIPHGFLQPRVIPLGFWFSRSMLGHCDAQGRITVLACGLAGLDATGPADRRLCGLSPRAWVEVVAHEIAHAAMNLSLGHELAAEIDQDPTRAPGEEPAGFDRFVAAVHLAVSGQPLPAGFDARRWPHGADGLDRFIDLFARAVADHALPALSEAEADALMPDDAEGQRLWLRALLEETTRRAEDQEAALAYAMRARQQEAAR